MVSLLGRRLSFASRKARRLQQRSPAIRSRKTQRLCHSGALLARCKQAKDLGGSGRLRCSVQVSFLNLQSSGAVPDLNPPLTDGAEGLTRTGAEIGSAHLTRERLNLSTLRFDLSRVSVHRVVQESRRGEVRQEQRGVAFGHAPDGFGKRDDYSISGDAGAFGFLDPDFFTVLPSAGDSKGPDRTGAKRHPGSDRRGGPPESFGTTRPLLT